MKYFLEDNIIGLRKIEITDDLSRYHQWFNSQEANKLNTHGIFPMTIREIQDFISVNSRTNLHLSIFIKETNEHIGNLSLQSIDYINRSGELAILVGESSCWGKGYSYKACKLLVDHAFNRLNLVRVYCGTSEQNFGMQKLALKLGMLEEGRRKGAIFSQGEYLDILEYGIFRNK